MCVCVCVCVLRVVCLTTRVGMVGNTTPVLLLLHHLLFEGAQALLERGDATGHAPMVDAAVNLPSTVSSG